MKRFAAFLVLLLSAAVFAQPKVDFREGRLADIIRIAQKEDKPILYMGYANWCSHCNMMKTEVLTDQKVADFYNKNFICMWQDMESGDGINVRKKFNVRAFPVFLFLDKDGELLYTASGEIKAGNFIKEGENALNPKMQLPYLKAQFEADMTNADNCLAYVSALRRSNLDTEAAAQKYLSKLTEEQLVSNMNWKIIANGVRDINSREFQYVLKKQSEFAAVSSQKRVERKIVNMVQEWLSPYVDANDTVNYFKKRVPAAKIALFKTDSLIYNYDLKILENTKGWKKYNETATAGVPKFSWDNAAQLKEIAKVYMNNIHEPKALDNAISWAKRSLERNNAYDMHIIIARLYFFRADKKQAKEWAEKAKAMAISYKFDTRQADEILNQIK